MIIINDINNNKKRFATGLKKKNVECEMESSTHTHTHTNTHTFTLLPITKSL